MNAPARTPSSAELRREVLDLVQGRHLVDEGAIARANRIAARTGQPVEQVLNQLGALTDDDLVKAYVEVTGLSVWEPAVTTPLTSLAGLALNPEYLRRAAILPLELDDHSILCAACDPLDPEITAGVGFATGLAVRLQIARPGDWRRAFDAFETHAPADRAELDEARLDREVDLVSDLGASSAGSRVVNSAFEAAIRLGASDIHFEPRRNDLRVRLRVDGRMVEHATVPADHAAATVSRVKVIANLDVGERRLPQDGRTSFVFAGRSIDVRVATSPTVFGESAVLRILDRSTVRLELPALGISPSICEQLLAAARAPHGMFLISGPTGSGKTTTLYALLQTFAGSPKKVLSVEDPVEYHFEHVTQTQVAPQIGLTFASALRSFLRQDPDVVLVGEIRDPETASVAVQAAMTGHLLLASVHANDALSVIPRLLDMGVEPFQLAAGFRGAAAQRLVRRLCPSCRERRPVSQVEDAFFGALEGPRPTVLYHPGGCRDCNGQGFKGRLAVAEAVIADDALTRAIAEKAHIGELAAIATRAGYRSMSGDAADKIRAGLTSYLEVVAALNG